MSLAEELLADFEDEGDDEEVTQNVNLMSETHVHNSPEHGIPESMEIEPERNNMEVRDIAKLRNSDTLVNIMSQINDMDCSTELKKCQIEGPIEAHPEYKLIVDANNLTVDIDNEIIFLHKYIREKYSKRFPELESLIVIPLDYIMTVRELGNDLTKVKYINNKAFLTQATIMVVSVTASTTQGSLLNETELKSIFEACDIAIDLNNSKSKIFYFVESRMSFIAPNVSTIVGANIAAKLIGLAGGLSSLSKMPACNIEILGSSKKTLAGFSSANSLAHTGFVFFSDIVENTPSDLRRKAARLVANKTAIAARVDALHSYPDGQSGRNLRENILRALDKLQEPPPVKQVKPLPQPIDQPKKKRGGKRVRRMKERLGMTEFRKQANRMNFGEIEDDAYQEDLGFTTGTIGKSGMGRIRAPQIDEKTKVKISKALQKTIHTQHSHGGNTSIRRQIAGTASSVAFTPLQGLEIVNPNAAETSVNEANAKYFSNSGGFFSVIKKTT